MFEFLFNRFKKLLSSSSSENLFFRVRVRQKDRVFSNSSLENLFFRVRQKDRFFGGLQPRKV